MRQWVHWSPLVRGSGLVEVGGSPLEWGLAPPQPPLLLLLLLLLTELVESLRRRSSRSNDFNGDTLISDGNGRLLDVAPLSSIPLLFGSCLMGIREIDGVIASSPPPTFLRKRPRIRDQVICVRITINCWCFSVYFKHTQLSLD